LYPTPRQGALRIAAAQHPYTCTPRRSKLEQSTQLWPLFLKEKKKKTICSHFRCQQASTEQLPMHVWLEISTWCDSATCTHQKLPRILQVPCSMHPEDILLVTRPRALRQPRRALRLLVSDCTCSTSTLPCAATTRLQPHRLYVSLTVCREYSSLGRSGSTSTTPYAAATSSSGCTTTSTTHLN
jgi:hypothetical protein